MRHKREYTLRWTIVVFTVLVPDAMAVFCEVPYKNNTVCDTYCPSPGRISTDCRNYNLAYGKASSQSFDPTTAGLAIDDDYSTCTGTTYVDEPYWEVDLGKDMSVHRLVMLLPLYTLNQMAAYEVKVQQEGSSGWQMCKLWWGQQAQASSPLTINCQRHLTGRYVRFTIPQNHTDLNICDVGIIGSCVNGSYGNHCENNCGNCLPLTDYRQMLCDTSSGRCTMGCEDGWSGIACTEHCPFKKYGRGCRKTCGECIYNRTCDRVTGICPDEFCEIEYQPPYCNVTCDEGTWDYNCVKECGHCKNMVTCNKTDGTCPDKCDPGYHYDPFNPNLCDTACQHNTYGNECENECAFCRQNNSVNPGPCNIVTGECELGCAPGYYQTSNYDCTHLCPSGVWGLNCANQCGNCGWLNDTVYIAVDCLLKDGSCENCMPGWQGAGCFETCAENTYGFNCAETCGQCVGSCDKVSGECPGDCKPGYLGNMCTQACSAGRYGNQCKQRCPPNCQNSTCSNVDGACVCKDGWTGARCEDSCPSNHYGKECAFVCGNCRDGTTCDQHDGMCPDGCQDMWVGLKCDAEKIIEVYKRSYGDVIGGSIGGVIALVLIGLFVAWVVWRYRKDKSIHIKALASSLRRMSLRGSQRIRKSIQRLSFRNRKAQDQRRLGKTADSPDTDSPAHQRGKASVPRMYECVRLQSNMIHYDDFTRLYLQLQETKAGGRTLLYESFESFLAQRPVDHSGEQKSHENGRAYYNAGHAGVDDIQIEMGSDKTKIPAFLPLGSNLSGFLLVNTPAISETLWNHLRQREIENIISIGKDASFVWTPGERIEIGQDIVDCVDVQLFASHRESKLTVQRKGVHGRRGIRHMECFIWNKLEKFPTIPTLLMFLDRFVQLQSRQRERSILVNYMNLHDQAIMFTLVASCLEIIREGKRVDILRTVATGGNATTKAVRTFDEFKYLHDVVFQYMASSDGSTSI